MRRREFIIALGGTVTAWPLIARAQQTEQVRRIGVLMGIANDPEGQARVDAFRQVLKGLGWTEGRNIQLHDRWAAGDPDRMRVFAAELVTMMPDAILVSTTAALVTLAQQTQSIPIVFAQSADPVSAGLTAGLGRPGGNITGFTAVEYSLGGKWVELLKQIAPAVANIGIVHNPSDPSAAGYVGASQTAAQSLGVRLAMVSVRNAAEIDPAIEAFASTPSGGLIIEPSAVTTVYRERIIAVAARRHLPAVYPYRFHCTSGGLVSYGFDNIYFYRRAASYVDRILRGTSPADLPIQLPTKFELVINLKTAAALDLTVPSSLLARADEVIE